LLWNLVEFHFLVQLAELFISAGQNTVWSVCLHVIRLAQIVTAAHRDLYTDLLMNPDCASKTTSVWPTLRVKINRR